jgi:hypothetical protein
LDVVGSECHVGSYQALVIMNLASVCLRQTLVEPELPPPGAAMFDSWVAVKGREGEGEEG